MSRGCEEGVQWSAMGQLGNLAAEEDTSSSRHG